MYVFLFTFSISARFDLHFAWSFFASASLVSPPLILSIRLITLSHSLNFASVVGTLYLYVNRINFFLSNLVIFWSLSSTNLLKIYFCFQTNGQSLSLSAYFLIVDCFNISLILNCFYLFFSLIVNCFYLFFKGLPRRQ